MLIIILCSITKTLLLGGGAFVAYIALNKKDRQNNSEYWSYLLSYFIFLAMLTVWESSFEALLTWLPMYYEIKLAIMLLATGMLYYRPSFLKDKVEFPLFNSFNNVIAPRLLSACDLLLYYVIVIISPFVSKEHLDDMRSYTNEASGEMNNKMAANPVQFTDFVTAVNDKNASPTTPAGEKTPVIPSPVKEIIHPHSFQVDESSDSDDDSDGDDPAYNRLSRTLPCGF